MFSKHILACNVSIAIPYCTDSMLLWISSHLGKHPFSPGWEVAWYILVQEVAWRPSFFDLATDWAALGCHGSVTSLDIQIHLPQSFN